MVYGYIRVSTREQNEDRQRIALRKAGIPEKNIFIDKQSGKDFDRPKYKKLLRRLKRDDLLYIKSIDRLGRDYEEVLEQWRLLTKDKNIDIVVLDMPLLDTRRGRDLMGAFLADIVLQVLSFVAENERTNIRQRQAEGIAAAKARGVQFGRDPRPLPENFWTAYEAWKAKRMTIQEAAKACGLPRSTFYDKVQKHKSPARAADAAGAGTAGTKGAGTEKRRPLLHLKGSPGGKIKAPAFPAGAQGGVRTVPPRPR